jgi:hypothetical protein
MSFAPSAPPALESAAPAAAPAATARAVAAAPVAELDTSAEELAPATPFEAAFARFLARQIDDLIDKLTVSPVS